MTEKSLGLVDKILFLTINYTRLGNLRTAHVELKTNANESRFQTSKKLLNSAELKMIAKRDREIKNSLRKFMLPYKMGCSIVPSVSGPAVRDILDAYEKVERPNLVKALLDVYDTQVAESKGELKDQFDEKQYRSKEEVAAEFTFDYDLFSLSLPADLKDTAHAKIMLAADGIADALAQAAHTMVSKLAASLSSNADGTAKKIYDKQFTVLQEFLAGFDIRNVVSHADLKAEMDKLKLLLDGVDAEKVRNNEGLRELLAVKMNEATLSLTTMVQNKPLRKFRDTEE